MQRMMVGALLVVLALGLAACGSSSGGSRSNGTTHAAPNTPTDRFRAQAVAICRGVSRQVIALQSRSTAATKKASLTQAADAMSAGLERLRALHPPAQLAARYKVLLAWKASQRDAALALAHGTKPSGRAALAINGHLAPITRVTRAMGLNGCY